MAVIALLPGAIATVFTLGNIAVVARNSLIGASGSLVPLLGGLAGFLALLACPIAGAWRWGWLPLLVDPGCSWLVIAFAYAILTGGLKKSGETDG